MVFPVSTRTIASPASPRAIGPSESTTAEDKHKAKGILPSDCRAVSHMLARETTQVRSAKILEKVSAGITGRRQTITLT